MTTKKCEACKGSGSLVFDGKPEICCECKGIGDKPFTAMPRGMHIGRGVIDRNSMLGVSSGCFRNPPKLYSDS